MILIYISYNGNYSHEIGKCVYGAGIQSRLTSNEREFRRKKKSRTNETFHMFSLHISVLILSLAEPHSSVGSFADLVIVIVILTGFIRLSPLSVLSTMVMWESSQLHGKNTSIVRSTG